MLCILLFFVPVFVWSQNDSNTVLQIQNRVKAFEDNNQLDSIEFYQTKALQLSEKIQYKRGMAYAYSAIGMVNKIKSNFPLALENYYKALRIFETLNNKTGISMQLGNIGQVYDYQGDQTKALDCYNKALNLAELLGDKRLISLQCQNLGTLYAEQDSVPQAEKYFFRSLEIDKAVNNKESIGLTLINLANIYYNAPDKSIKYYTDALNIFKELGKQDHVAQSLLNISAAYADLKQKDRSLDYLRQASLLSDQLEVSEFKPQLEKMASQIYAVFGDDKQALVHYKKFIALRDSFYNEQNTKQSMKAEMNYEFEKKQAAIKFENDKIIYELNADNKRQKQLKIFLLAFTILILILLFFAKRAYDNKKKYSDILSKENDTKEALLQEVHHRINNSLQMISSLLAFQAGSTTNEEVQQYLSKSNARIQAMSAMHELLHQNNTLLEVDIDAYILKVLDFYKTALEASQKIIFNTNLPSVRFHSKTALPIALIVNELVTNAIKHAFPDDRTGIINISLIKDTADPTAWILTVSDNGIGLPENYSANKKNRLGLRLVNIMTKQIDGTLNIIHQNGSCFQITFSNAQGY